MIDGRSTKEIAIESTEGMEPGDTLDFGHETLVVLAVLDHQRLSVAIEHPQEGPG